MFVFYAPQKINLDGNVLCPALLSSTSCMLLKNNSLSLPPVVYVFLSRMPICVSASLPILWTFLADAVQMLKLQ